jgi:hypothetical protein
MTREFFDALIIGVILIGLALAIVRLRQDLTRPLPPEEIEPDDDTKPRRPSDTQESN